MNVVSQPAAENQPDVPQPVLPTSSCVCRQFHELQVRSCNLLQGDYAGLLKQTLATKETLTCIINGQQQTINEPLQQLYDKIGHLQLQNMAVPTTQVLLLTKEFLLPLSPCSCPFRLDLEQQLHEKCRMQVQYEQLQQLHDELDVTFTKREDRIIHRNKQKILELLQTNVDLLKTCVSNNQMLMNKRRADRLNGDAEPAQAPESA